MTPPANAGDTRDVDLIPGLGRFPGEEIGNPLQYSCLVNSMGRETWQATPVFLPGKFHRQRNLAGYSPWGCKELDTTE